MPIDIKKILAEKAVDITKDIKNELKKDVIDIIESINKKEKE